METGSIYKGGLILLIGFIFVKIGGFVFRIICMGMLPVEQYGEVALFLVLFNWFALFATMNVSIGLAKFVSEKPAKRRLYYAASFWGTLLLSLVVSAVLILLSPALSEAINLRVPVIYWAIACVPISVIYNVGIFYLRGNYEMGRSTRADAAMMVVRIAVLAALLYAGLTYAPYLAFVLSFAFIDAYLVGRNRGLLEFGISEIFPEFRKILLYSFPVFLSEFLRFFAMGFDRIALSGFYSTAEAGMYDVAVALCLGYVIIANSYSNALLPVASASQKDRERRKRALFKSVKASAVLFAAYTILIGVAGRPVISIINPAYMGVFGFLSPLIAAYVLIGFLTILYFFANSVGLQRYALYAGVVFAFLSLSLNFYLVPAMLYEGAAASLIISSAASIGVMGALIWKSERSLS
jgi:stage V sporulation protein B